MRAVAAAFVAAVTVGSLLPEEVAGRLVTGSRGLHFAAYLIMAAIVCWSGPRTGAWVALGLGGCVAWGAILELMQSYVPGRAADWADVAENAAGAVGGAVIVAAIRLKGMRRSAEGS